MATAPVSSFGSPGPLPPNSIFNQFLVPNLSQDMWLAQPPELLRRAFDELSRLMHWFILGCLIVKHKDPKPLRFDVRNPMKRTQKRVYGIAVYQQVKDGQVCTYWPSDKSVTALQAIKVYQECYASQDCDKLLQHILKCGSYYGDKTAQIANALFCARCIVRHRTYLYLDKDSASSCLLKLGKSVFADIKKLVPASKLVSSLEALPYIMIAVNSHLQSLSNLENVFLMSIRRTPDPVDACIAKVDQVLIELREENHSNVVDFSVAAKFALGVLGPRFRSEWPGGDTKNDDVEEVKVASTKLEIDQQLVCAVGKRFLVSHAWWDSKVVLVSDNYHVIDPFSTTHLDLINRCIDLLTRVLSMYVDTEPGARDRFEDPDFGIEKEELKQNVVTVMKIIAPDVMKDKKPGQINTDVALYNFSTLVVFLRKCTPNENLREALKRLNNYLNSVWHQGNVREPMNLTRQNVEDVVNDIKNVALAYDSARTNAATDEILLISNALPNYFWFRSRGRNLAKHGGSPEKMLTSCSRIMTKLAAYLREQKANNARTALENSFIQLLGSYTSILHFKPPEARPLLPARPQPQPAKSHLTFSYSILAELEDESDGLSEFVEYEPEGDDEETALTIRTGEVPFAEFEAKTDVFSDVEAKTDVSSDVETKTDVSSPSTSQSETPSDRSVSDVAKKKKRRGKH